MYFRNINPMPVYIPQAKAGGFDGGVLSILHFTREVNGSIFSVSLKMPQTQKINIGFEATRLRLLRW